MVSKKDILIWKRNLHVTIANQDPKRIAVNSSVLGEACLTTGKYQKAIKHFETSLDISAQIGQLHGVAVSNGNLGNAYLRIGQYQNAVNYYCNAIEINAKLGTDQELQMTITIWVVLTPN